MIIFQCGQSILISLPSSLLWPVQKTSSVLSQHQISLTKKKKMRRTTKILLVGVSTILAIFWLSFFVIAPQISNERSQVYSVTVLVRILQYTLRSLPPSATLRHNISRRCRHYCKLRSSDQSLSRQTQSVCHRLWYQH